MLPPNNFSKSSAPAPPQLDPSLSRLLQGLTSAENAGKRLLPGELEKMAETPQENSATDVTQSDFDMCNGQMAHASEDAEDSEDEGPAVTPGVEVKPGRIIRTPGLQDANASTRPRPASETEFETALVPGQIVRTPGLVQPLGGPLGVPASTIVEDVDVKIVDPNGVQVSESDPELQRYRTFAEAAFPSHLKRLLLAAGFAAPSQIQQYSWPLALQGRDVIGVAATGSGKTLGYLLPVFSWIMQHNPRQGPVFLVIVPTRELAMQIDEESKKYGAGFGITVACCFGGEKKKKQVGKIRSRHGIIGTPGRLNDFLETGDLVVDNVKKVVFDEADRMLDMGFEPQIRQVADKLPAQRQTLFFTATWPNAVRRLSSEFLKDPFQVHIGNRDTLKGNQDITQIIKPVKASEKMGKLIQTLQDYKILETQTCKALCFVNHKRMCTDLEAELTQSNVPVASLHGDKSQAARTTALDSFKICQTKVLVATDVAARGLDIPGVTLVVNYDLPDVVEDYVHRIGRAGRAGAKGIAVSLVSYRDYGKLSSIVEVMKRTDQKVDAEVERIAKRGGPPIPVFRKGVRVDVGGPSIFTQTTSRVCADYQRGNCTRGRNCKFSHDDGSDAIDFSDPRTENYRVRDRSLRTKRGFERDLGPICSTGRDRGRSRSRIRTDSRERSRNHRDHRSRYPSRDRSRHRSHNRSRCHER